MLPMRLEYTVTTSAGAEATFSNRVYTGVVVIALMSLASCIR